MQSLCLKGKRLKRSVFWLSIGLVGAAALLGVQIVRPIFGLTILIVLLWLVPPLLKRSPQLDPSALSFFYGLLGLLRVGICFPSALFQLCENLPGEFPSSLKRSLNQYERGNSLGGCLTRFRSRSALAQWLGLIQLAYDKGLAMVPLLEKILPLLESDWEFLSRQRSVMRAAFVQALVAGLVPWILAGALHFFQPELLERFFSSPVAKQVIGMSFLLQTCGLFCIRRVSQFC